MMEEQSRFQRHVRQKKKGVKQLNPKIPPASAPHPEPSEYMCLVRAVFKNEKISTVIHSKEVNKFQLAYCNLLKSNMDGLKRQKKQKNKESHSVVAVLDLIKHIPWFPC